MWAFKRRKFKWEEPRDFRSVKEGLEKQSWRWWYRPLAVLIVFAALMSNWAIVRLNPNKQPPPMWQVIPIALMGSVVFIYVVPLLYRMAPTGIHVYDDKIIRVCGDKGFRLKFKDTRSFRIEDCDAYYVLSLEDVKGKEILFGVPKTVDLPSLQKHLQDHVLAKFGAGD